MTIEGIEYCRVGQWPIAGTYQFRGVQRAVE
jgi:hypothetical protein